jgi:hypothetical protein
MKSFFPTRNIRLILFVLLSSSLFFINDVEAACTQSASRVNCDASSPNPDSYNNTSSGVLSEFVVGPTATASFINTGDVSGGVSGDLNGGAVFVFGGGSLTLFQNIGTINGLTPSGSGETNVGVQLYFPLFGSGISNLGSLVNTGTITGVGADAISNFGSISTITNTGTINSTEVSSFFGTSTGFGINNYNGTIVTLNNLQGASSSALTYAGNLPTNYNIIINSPTSFGRLAVTSGTGTTTFGIYTGSTVRNGTYAAVLSGLTLGNLTSTSGTFGSGSWILNNSSADIWDLILSGYIDAVVLTGPSVANTNQSLVNTSSALQGTYTLQNSVLANSFSYDCNVFGANNVCVSAGGRNTTVQAANGLNNTSALLIAAYRPHPNYRIGAYADQNLSVSNPGGTVNLGNNTPLIGLFGAWTQRLSGTGAEVKVSAAYGQKNTTITRSVVGSGATASEAGTGSSTLNSQGAQITAKYGFGVVEDLIVSPYVGVRYTQNNMGGYTEATSSSVTAPLTYSALNTNATTALAGVGASYRVIPTVTTFASAGVETDTNTANGTYSATNASIGTLTPVNFNANPVRTRPTATLGAYYDVAKNQRFGVTGIYRQEAYQAVSTTTVMATYTIGL